jgi:hypothetical protein
MSVDDMLAACSASVNATASMISTMRNVSARHNLTLGTYEAGPSIVEAATIFSGSETAGAKDK